MQSLRELNEALARLTVVSRMEFGVDPSSGDCTLILELRYSPANGGAGVRLFLRGVQSLSVSGFGGGTTQLKCLRGRDARAEQHDRINFVFEDLEDRALAARCTDWRCTLL